MNDLVDADDLINAVNDVVILIADVADRHELPELSDDEAEWLRQQVRALAGVIETLIEKTRPEPMFES